MATPETSRSRPLSPHLQVYRWQITMTMSILHRATGIALAIGAIGLVWWLLAVAAGGESYDRAMACIASPFGLFLLAGFSLSLVYHLLNGIRHLVQDAGYAYRIESFVRNSWISIFGSLALTVLIWVVAMMQRGAA